MTTECSISLWTISQPLPMALNGPMKLSTTRVSRPIATGPRIVELTICAPSATTTRPSSDEAASTVPSICVAIFSSSRRFASSSGVSLPVSIHHPVSSSVRTRLPLVISHWMASVISSSPRADGAIARTASWIVRSKR